MEGGSTIISIAFMFSPIYLRLEDNVQCTGILESDDIPPAPHLSSKNEMFLFGLRSTSDDWPSDLSNKS